MIMAHKLSTLPKPDRFSRKAGSLLLSTRQVFFERILFVYPITLVFAKYSTYLKRSKPSLALYRVDAHGIILFLELCYEAERPNQLCIWVICIEQSKKL